MNKKAVEQWVVYLVIGLSSLIVILVISYAFFGVSNDNAKKNECKQSVNGVSRMHIAGTDISNGLRCPTEYHTITTSDKEMIQKEVANYLFDCWDNFLEGKLELFSKTESEKVFCVACSKIEFSKKNIISDNFTKYLAEHNVPGKSPDISYFSYFMNVNTNPDLIEKIPELVASAAIPDFINTSKNYAIVFVHSKNNQALSAFKRVWSMGALGAIFGGAPEQGYGSEIALVPVEELSSLPCQELPASQT